MVVQPKLCMLHIFLDTLHLIHLIECMWYRHTWHVLLWNVLRFRFLLLIAYFLYIYFVYIHVFFELSSVHCSMFILGAIKLFLNPLILIL